MKTLLSCEFNMDTGCVELRYSDDSMISINCTAVEDEVANSRVPSRFMRKIVCRLRLNEVSRQ